MNILTVNYNTPVLIQTLVRSIRKHTDCKIYVFDNSDKEPFTKRMDGVEVIDNTRGQVFRLQDLLEQYPDRKKGFFSAWGSVMHTKSVDACFDILGDGFIRMDSDVLVKKDVTPLWDESVACGGEVRNDSGAKEYIVRLIPQLCYINVPMCLRHGVRYFNGEYMWNLSQKRPNCFYDTGAWFLKDALAKGLPHNEFVMDDYMVHYAHGSHEIMNVDVGDWLLEHKDLWK